MTTERLDVEDLLKAAHGTDWAGFPEGGCIGHVHLRVGDTVVADRFYRDVLGFRTNGEFGRGSVVIDDRSPQIFRGSDGSSCTIRAPKVRFQIQ